MPLLTHLLAALAGGIGGAIFMAIFTLDNPEKKPRRGYDALDEDAVRDWHGRRVGS